MIDKARRRGVYDRLEVGDLVDTLRRSRTNRRAAQARPLPKLRLRPPRDAGEVSGMRDHFNH
jgi:hypothetical protein